MLPSACNTHFYTLNEQQISNIGEAKAWKVIKRLIHCLQPSRWESRLDFYEPNEENLTQDFHAGICSSFRAPHSAKNTRNFLFVRFYGSTRESPERILKQKEARKASMLSASHTHTHSTHWKEIKFTSYTQRV